MAVITGNIPVADDVMLMTCTGNGVTPKPGQFYMVRAWGLDPLLSRPISVHDASEGEVVFLYRIVGKGTQILSQKQIGDEITLEGPFGNGFPDVQSDLVVVGGGIGIAPLYYTCRSFKEKNPEKRLRVYLGFSDQAYCVDAFKEVADSLILDIGGIITDQVEVNEEETVFACGPQVMFDALCAKIPEGIPMYLSLESRMACGLGACLGCGIMTAEGRKRVCKDGPVFDRRVLR